VTVPTSAVNEPLGHAGDDGQPCTRHVPVSLDTLLHFATIGSRISSFHHDIASKLQGLMMALDEISELVEPGGDTDLGRAAETAHAALKELTQIFMLNRALAKAPIRGRTTLRELAARASERVGVQPRGALPEVTVEVAVPLITQGFALAFDIAAGAGRSRSLELTASVVDARVELVLPAAPPSANANESLAIAAWVFAHEGGDLRCSESQILLRLPIVS
jgi:hypothetical protein